MNTMKNINCKYIQENQFASFFQFSNTCVLENLIFGTQTEEIKKIPKDIL